MKELNEYKIITEFGRSIFTKRGISVSKIETVKDWGEKRVAMAHFGSNQFIREGDSLLFLINNNLEFSIYFFK